MLDTDVRLIVATLKINNDLERMGDLAVNLSERAISLSQMGDVHIPGGLEPMTTAVRAMVSKCLGALIYQNVDLATQVLESDDVVDQYRDQVFEALLAGMTANPALAAPNLHYVLASRHLERIADHATNIAEDILFWVRGLEVRHGRAKQMELNLTPPATPRISRRVIAHFTARSSAIQVCPLGCPSGLEGDRCSAAQPQFASTGESADHEFGLTSSCAAPCSAGSSTPRTNHPRGAARPHPRGCASPLLQCRVAYFTPNSRRCNTPVTLQSKNDTEEIP